MREANMLSYNQIELNYRILRRWRAANKEVSRSFTCEGSYWGRLDSSCYSWVYYNVE